MVKTNRQFLNDFIIVSSLSNQKKLIENLSHMARQAYFLRDYARLETIGEGLIELSPRSEYIGRYYCALANGRQWKGDQAKMIKEFEFLSELPALRSSALVAIAGSQIALGKPDFGTNRLLWEASKIALSSKDYLTYINTQRVLSVLCSIAGDHEKSLDILRGLQPAVDYLGSHCSIIKSDFYNSVAWDLLQSGNAKAAAYFITPVLRSPYLSVYPEWAETAIEINNALPKKNDFACPPSKIFSGYFNPGVFEEYLGKKAFFSQSVVRTLPIRESEAEPNLTIYSDSRNFTQILLSKNQNAAQEAMQEFLFGADEISARQHGKGMVFFETFFCSTGMYSLIAEHSIRYEYLGLLNDLIKEANGLNKDKPAPPTPPARTRTDKTETRKTVEWLMPKLNENLK
jgi:hypothetical protein